MTPNEYTRKLRIEDLIITCDHKGKWHGLLNGTSYPKWAYGDTLEDVLKQLSTNHVVEKEKIE